MSDERFIDRIIEAIALRGQPMTQQQLATATGLPLKQVRGAVSGAIARTGGVVHAGRIGLFKLYGLPGMMVKPKPKADMPRRYDPPFKVLERNPFEHRDLALVGPR